MLTLATSSQIDLWRQVDEYAKSEVLPATDKIEESREFAAGLIKEIAKLGWVGAAIEPRYGGTGLGHVARTIPIDALGYTNAAIAAGHQACSLGADPIRNHGTEEQKRHWLPPICSGEVLATIAVTEPSAGGSIGRIEMTAERDGDHYILNGVKSFVGNVAIADVHCVIARTSDEGVNGLSAFIVEANRKGVSVRLADGRLGLIGFSLDSLVLERCRVPANNMLGAPGDGKAVAQATSMLCGRPNLAAIGLGLQRSARDEAIRFLRSRKRGSETLLDMAPIKQKIGEIEANIEIAEAILYQAAALLDRGEPCDRALCTAKKMSYELMASSVHSAMMLCGASGLVSSLTRMPQIWRDAPHIYAPAGTGDVQEYLLAKEATGAERVEWSVRFPAPFPSAA